jgi:hypothetical protein
VKVKRVAARGCAESGRSLGLVLLGFNAAPYCNARIQDKYCARITERHRVLAALNGQRREAEPPHGLRWIGTRCHVEEKRATLWSVCTRKGTNKIPHRKCRVVDNETQEVAGLHGMLRQVDLELLCVSACCVGHESAYDRVG